MGVLRPTIDQALDQPSVRPVTLLDLEDLEELAGLVAAGDSLIAILNETTSAPWQALEFTRWLKANRTSPRDSAITRAHFDQAIHEAFEAI